MAARLSSAQCLLQFVQCALLPGPPSSCWRGFCTIFFKASYDFEWFMAVCWRVTESKIPTRDDRTCISLTSSPVTSSTNFILRSISVNNALVSPGLLAGRATMPESSAMTMPCRAASPGSNRCFNLCQALKPSSSLMLITTSLTLPE